MKVALAFVLSLVLTGWLLYWAGVGSPTQLLKKVRNPGKSKWESHPCELPTKLDLPLEGCVWQCHCGRRWKYLRTKKNDQEFPFAQRVNIWEERTPEMDMKEEMEKLEKLTRKAKESGL